MSSQNPIYLVSFSLISGSPTRLVDINYLKSSKQFPHFTEKKEEHFPPRSVIKRNSHFSS